MGNKPDFYLDKVKRGSTDRSNLPFYWYPGRFGIQFGPESFRNRLKDELGEELEVTWSPIHERWLIWTKAPQVTYPLCPGWKLLFVHNGPDGSFAPLDERVFARLYSASAQKWGSGKKYLDHILAEMERDRAKYEEKSRQDAIDASMPYFDHSQIQISMRGQSNGSKFADYQA